MLQDGRWYAIQVKSKFEKVVAQTLAGRGYDQFLPLASSRRQWSDRVKTLEAPTDPWSCVLSHRESGLRPGRDGMPRATEEHEIAALK